MAIRSTGDIIAENYIISSSVTYMTQSFASGSSVFGNTQDDTHKFTGSLNITGSVSASGTGSFGVLKTGDIELENERGHWRIVEESEYLSIHNVKHDKKYKFVLQEIE